MIERGAGPAVVPFGGRCFSHPGALFALIFCALLVATSAVAGSASAAYVHPVETRGFGPDGTSATEFTTENSFEELRGELVGFNGEMWFDQTDDRLFAMYNLAEQGYSVGAWDVDGEGSATPAGGSFPKSISTGFFWTAAEDESSSAGKGRTYFQTGYSSEEPPAVWNSNGEPVQGLSFSLGTEGNHNGIAVDSEGNVFIANSGTKEIEVFEPAGGPAFRSFSTAGLPEGEPERMVIDKKTDDLFVFNSYPKLNIYRLTKDANYEDQDPVTYHSGYNPRMAVDSSLGVLYVVGGETEGKIKAFDIATGSILEEPKTAAEPASEGVAGIAVDEDTHTIFTADNAYGIGGKQIKEWRAVRVADVVTGEPTGNVTVSGTVDPAGTGDVTECRFEYGPALNEYTSSAPCTPGGAITSSTPVSAELTGLADETTYHFRLVAINAAGKAVGGDQTITPHKVKALTTEPAEEVKRTGAKLTGSYEGTAEATGYWFEYGTTPSLGTATTEGEKSAGSGLTQVSTVIEGLSPDEIYFYRVAAKNSKGESKGEILSFHTAPAVQSPEAKPATEVKPHGAVLNGSLVGDGTPTEYFYEWGADQQYGHTTATKSTSGSGLQSLQGAEISGLLTETIYHYRVVATNSIGTTRSADATLKTLPAVTGLETKPVTDLESHSATLNGALTGDGTKTTYFYRWGTSSGYGNTSPTMETSATGVTQLTPHHLEGLEAGTTYHFQIVAENGEGTTKTADATFSTIPAVRGLKTLPASNVGTESIQLNAEFEGNGQDTHYHFEFGPTTSYGTKTATPPGLDAGSPTGVMQLSATITDYLAYTTYHYRVVAENAEGITVGNDQTVDTPPAELPNIRNQQASGITPSSATLSAEIDPMRWDTVYLFEYGTSPAYGEFTELNPKPIGDDHAFHPVSESVSDLQPGTIYHFRVVAINYTGTRFGSDQTFATPSAPTIDLVSVRGITQSSAHLVGLVNPNSTPTSVHFDYGPTPAYGFSTAATGIGSGRVDSEAGADIGGLTADTTYHFRVVATNANGTVESRDQTFTTAPGSARRGGQKLKCKKPRVKRHGKCVKPRHKKHHKKGHRKSKHRNG